MSWWCFGQSKNEEYSKKLSVAISQKDEVKVEQLFEKGKIAEYRVDINDGKEYFKYDTYLCKAVMSGSVKIVEILLKNGADPNIPTKVGDMVYAYPLTYAIEKSNLEIAGMLLNAGADPNKSFFRGNNIVNAAKKNDIEMIKLLISKKADLNKMEDSFSALSHAVNNNNIEAVRILIKEGADVDLSSPLAIALKKQNIPIIKILLEAGASTNKDYRVAQEMIHSGNIEIIDYVLKNGQYISDRDLILPALQYQSRKGPLDPILGYLVNQRGIDLNKVFFFDGSSPFTHSIRFHYTPENINDLVNHGADPNIADLNKNLPLKLAHTYCISLVKPLLMKGADPNLLDTSFVVGLEPQKLKLLLEGGLNTRQQDLEKALILLGAKNFIQNLYSSNNLKLYDPNQNEIVFSPDAKNDPEFYNNIIKMISDESASFSIQINGQPYEIKNFENLEYVIRQSLNREPNFDFVSPSLQDSFSLISGQTPINIFSSPDMILTHAKNFVNDEIIGLRSLESKFPMDVLSHIAEFLSFDRYLSSISKHGNLNVIEYVFSMLTNNPFIDYKNKQFSDDVNLMLSPEGQIFIDVSLPTTAIKYLTENRENGAPLINIVSTRVEPSIIIDFATLKEVKENIASNGYWKTVMSWLNNQATKIFHNSETNKLEDLLKRNGIDVPWHKAIFDKDSYKQIILALHPDKGGTTQDFQDFLQLKNIISDQMKNANGKWQSLIHESCSKVTQFSKVANFGFDGINFAKDPQIDLGYKLLMSGVEVVSFAAGMPNIAIFKNIVFSRDNPSLNSPEAILSNVLVATAIIALVKASPTIGLALSACSTIYTLYDTGSRIHEYISGEGWEIWNAYRSDLVNTLEAVAANNFLAGSPSQLAIEV